MKPLVEFTVIGRAEPAGSKTAVPQGERWGVKDANPRAKGWKRIVAERAFEATGAQGPEDLLTGPLEVQFVFYVQRPRGHFGTGRNVAKLKDSAPSFPATRPDVLKLARGVEDALTSVVWRDDAQIVTEHLVKRYGAPVRVEIKVWRAISYEDAVRAA